jgi:Kef-type K+ transport system membrane component KefB
MHDFPHLLSVLVAIIVATKLLGEAAQRIGQPAVLGELVAGVVLGVSALGVLDPGDPVISALSEIGVIVLLFEIGLHTDLQSLLKVGSSALVVGLVGVLVPFVLGYWVASLIGLPVVSAVVCGAALTATSIGISARVLSDLGQLDTPEGQVVLGAAVLDDVVGLIILAVVSGMAAGAGVSLAGVGVNVAVSVGFIVAALLLGGLLAPPLFRVIDRLQTSGALGLLALGFAFLLAWMAAEARSAPIIGAFAAGLVLHRTPQRHDIEKKVTTLGHFFVPIFFAAVGAAVDLRTLVDGQVALVGGALILVALVGKFVAGYAPWWFRGNKAMVGISMIPRGEVGLIFAQMGLSTGALDVGLFSAIALMVMVSTFLPPPILARMSSTHPLPPNLADQPGDGGIDDLVSGEMK